MMMMMTMTIASSFTLIQLKKYWSFAGAPVVHADEENNDNASYFAFKV